MTSIYNTLNADGLTLSAKVVGASKGKERDKAIQTTDRQWLGDRGQERERERDGEAGGVKEVFSLN